MRVQVISLGKSFVAHLALELLLLFQGLVQVLDGLVPDQVALLSEASVALRTIIRSDPLVHPQVVEQVPRFSKLLPAVVVPANIRDHVPLQSAVPPLGLLVLKRLQQHVIDLLFGHVRVSKLCDLLRLLISSEVFIYKQVQVFILFSYLYTRLRVFTKTVRIGKALDEVFRPLQLRNSTQSISCFRDHMILNVLNDVCCLYGQCICWLVLEL
mmetsp:Transcript_4868/g.5755  ORF Transcript_4868/g.5755 Transcript_4868/m.5755 type:complete len:212 (+) Transcript_4868:51-686(+)